MMARDQENALRPAKADLPLPGDRESAPARRRLVLRGAAAAVPTVLTLHSGSALAARSSFLISRAEGMPLSDDGKYLCMDLTGTTEVGPNIYDLGDNSNPLVTKIDGSATYYKDAEGNLPATVIEVCETGDPYYKRGGMASGQMASAPTPGQSSLIRQSKGVAAAPTASSPTEGLTQVQVSGRGMLVSATALQSFASRIIVKEI